MWRHRKETLYYWNYFINLFVGVKTIQNINKEGKLFDGIDVSHVGMVHLKDKSCSGKCKMCWEGHKIWKNLPPLFERQNNVGDFFLIFVAFSKYLNIIRHSLNWQTLCERNKKIWISDYIFLFRLGFKFWCPEMTEFPNEIIDHGS